jgi:hypothetical protein
MSARLDDEYRHRVSKAIAQAVIRTSLAEGANVAILRSGEIVNALIAQIAFFMASSEATRSPTATREFCDAVAKRLRREVTAVKEAQAAGALDFITIISEFGGPPDGETIQ